MADTKNDKKYQSNRFQSSCFPKTFFDSYMEVVQVSRVNLTIPDGDFKAEVLNVYKAEPPEAIR